MPSYKVHSFVSPRHNHNSNPYMPSTNSYSLFSDCRLESPTEWTGWSSCSEPCGGGKALRTRKVPSGCGSSCSLENLTESRTCNSEPCSCPSLPPSTEWSPWTSCSATESCGGEGVETRTRRVLISQGTSCFMENRTLVRGCNTEPCPCPHVPTRWSEWTECSASCGGGVHKRSRDAILGAGSSCLKHAAVQTKTCNLDSCPEKCSWWEFLDGKVFRGFPSDSTTRSCYDDTSLLSSEAQKYFVGMGSEYIDKISPVKSVCGVCIRFTTLEGKVGQILALHIPLNSDLRHFLYLGSILLSNFRRLQEL